MRRDHHAGMFQRSPSGCPKPPNTPNQGGFSVTAKPALTYGNIPEGATDTLIADGMWNMSRALAWKIATGCQERDLLHSTLHTDRVCVRIETEIILSRIP